MSDGTLAGMSGRQGLLIQHKHLWDRILGVGGREEAPPLSVKRDPARMLGRTSHSGLPFPWTELLPYPPTSTQSILPLLRI